MDLTPPPPLPLPNPLPLSVNMVVHNEAHRIAATLLALRPYVDEIVLADQSSTDGTPILAAPYVDVLLTHPHYGHCEPSRESCAIASSHDWLLILDADEQVTPAGWSVIADALNSDAEVIYLTIENHVGGRYVQTDLMTCPRLVRSSKVTFADHLHGVITPRPGARTAHLSPAALIHTKSVAEQQADWDRYSRIEGRPRGTWTDESRFT